MVVRGRNQEREETEGKRVRQGGRESMYIYVHVLFFFSNILRDKYANGKWSVYRFSFLEIRCSGENQYNLMIYKILGPPATWRYKNICRSATWRFRSVYRKFNGLIDSQMLFSYFSTLHSTPPRATILMGFISSPIQIQVLTFYGVKSSSILPLSIITHHVECNDLIKYKVLLALRQGHG